MLKVIKYDDICTIDGIQIIYLLSETITLSVSSSELPRMGPENRCSDVTAVFAHQLKYYHELMGVLLEV